MKVKHTKTRAGGSRTSGTLFSMDTPDGECVHTAFCPKTNDYLTGVVDEVIEISGCWAGMLPLRYGDSTDLSKIIARK